MTAWRRTPRKTTGGKPRAAPEHKLQVAVREYLMICLHPSVEWTANAAGVRVTPMVASRMKASGVRRGWPDLQFLFPDGVTRYIELKAGAGLSPEQRDFRDRATPHAIWALCKSVDEVATTLRGWGAHLRERTDFAPFSSTGEA